jgi:hypothetical protein
MLRLYTEYTTATRGNAYGTSPICSYCQRPQTRSYGSGCTAAGAPRTHFQVPGIARDAKDKIVSQGLEAKFRGVGFTEHYGPCLFQSCHMDSIFFRHEIPEQLAAKCGAYAFGKYQILD